MCGKCARVRVLSVCVGLDCVVCTCVFVCLECVCVEFVACVFG